MYLLYNVNLSFVKNNIMVNKYFVQYPFFLSEIFFLTLKSKQEERTLFKMFPAFIIFPEKNSILNKINQFLSFNYNNSTYMIQLLMQLRTEI